MAEKQSRIGRALRNFGDVINMGVNTATAGMLNRGVGALMGANSDQVTRANEARAQRVGLPGDVAQGLGAVFGLGKASDVAVGGVRMARALPTAAALARTAGPATAARYALGMPAAASGARMTAFGDRIGRSAGQLVPVVEKAAQVGTKAKLATAGKVLGAGAVVGGSVALGRDDKVTPMGNGGPQGQYNQAELDAREAFVANPQWASDVQPVPRGEQQLMPHEQQLALINAILQSPNATMSDLKAATAMLPDQPKPEKRKDMEFGRSADLSRAIFESQVASIAARKDAGELTEEEAQAAISQTMDEEFQRQAGLQGVNPMNLTMAQMQAQPQE